ncbi:hypothetical protein DFJ77DRAFT_441349 [Powellomyces hirtus]|nr:hypothetical protein DFJ77DRAFT_441349 [Powellomyces hirtus]
MICCESCKRPGEISSKRAWKAKSKRRSSDANSAVLLPKDNKAMTLTSSPAQKKILCPRCAFTKRTREQCLSNSKTSAESGHLKRQSKLVEDDDVFKPFAESMAFVILPSWGSILDTAVDNIKQYALAKQRSKVDEKRLLGAALEHPCKHIYYQLCHEAVNRVCLWSLVEVKKCMDDMLEKQGDVAEIRKHLEIYDKWKARALETDKLGSPYKEYAELIHEEVEAKLEIRQADMPIDNKAHLYSGWSSLALVQDENLREEILGKASLITMMTWVPRALNAEPLSSAAVPKAETTCTPTVPPSPTSITLEKLGAKMSNLQTDDHGQRKSDDPDGT